jgi:hypothetical protein
MAARISPSTGTGEINISDWSAFFAYDVISQLCFGEKFGFVTEGRDRWGLVEGFRKGMYSQGLYARLPYWYKFVQMLPNFMARWVDGSINDPNGIGAVVAQRDRLVDERIRQREEGIYKEKGDILDQLRPPLRRLHVD